MKCIVPGVNLKIFGKAIHSLSKIGEELYLEPLDHGLAIRTVNSCRSAYACFLFAPSFFTHYDDGSGTTPNDNPDDEGLRCKIGMKSCLSVFKSLGTIEKIVDKCKITLDMKESRLIFQLYCRHGIVKTYNLTFIECETLQAVFDKSSCPNRLTTQSRLLSECVVNFQANQEEISLIYDMDKCKIKNYTDDEPDPLKVIKTEMKLDPGEFESYQISDEGEVTFCLKELRGILAFSEAANLPLTIQFEAAGKPIVFSIDSDPTFEANFVLATLAEASSQVTASQRATQTQVSQHQRKVFPRSYTLPGAGGDNRNNGPGGNAYNFSQQETVHPGPKPPERSRNTETVPPGPKPPERSRNTETVPPGPKPPERSRDTETVPPGPKPPERSRDKEAVHTGPKPPKRSRDTTAAHQTDTAADPSTSSTRDPTSSIQEQSIEKPRQSAASRVSAAFEEFLQEEVDDDLPDFDTAMKSLSQSRLSHEEQSQVIPVLAESCPPPPRPPSTEMRPPPRLPSSNSQYKNLSDDEEEGDDIPGTPPAKKFKSKFFGLSQSTIGSQTNPANPSFGAVLAEDSEED